MTGIVKTKMNYWIIMELMRFLRQSNKMISLCSFFICFKFLHNKKFSIVLALIVCFVYKIADILTTPSPAYWTNFLSTVRIFIFVRGERTLRDEQSKRTLTSAYTLCFLGKPSHLLGFNLNGIQVIFKLRMEIFGIESLLTLMWRI